MVLGVRLGSVRLGGAAKPHFEGLKSIVWGPQRADKHHYGENPNYSYFTLFLRGVRPSVEKGLEDTARLWGAGCQTVYQPLKRFIVHHNPDIRLQFVTLASFTVSSMCITGYYNDFYQKIIDMTSMVEHEVAEDYARDGFWQQKREEDEQRKRDMMEKKQSLLRDWDNALNEANKYNSFAVLCSHLDSNSVLDAESNSVSEPNLELKILPKVSWRFNMMPYGADNDDTQTFPTPASEMPLRSFSLSFTTNNLSGNWGDYVNRQDNKGSIMRPSRQMFTDVYIGPTK